MAECSSDEYRCDLRVILVGKSGNGKSATGNTILGKTAFNSKRSPSSVTQECSKDSGYRADIQCNVMVVDPPGLFHTDQPFAKRALQIQNALEICPNPHAFLIVLNPEIRYSQEESLTIDMLRVIFGEVFLHHAILVYTRGSVYENDEELENELRVNDANTSLRDECKNRVARIENNSRIDGAIREPLTKGLFREIEKLSDGGKRYYQYELLNVHRRCLEEHSKNRKTDAKLGEELQQLVETLSKELAKHTESYWRKYLVSGWKVAPVPFVIGGLAMLAGYLRK